MHEAIIRFLQLEGAASFEGGQLLMIVLAGLLIFYSAGKEFGRQLLLPIGLGAFLANLPGNELLYPPLGGEPGGLLYYLSAGAVLQLLPLLILFGIGAAIDFGPLLARPYSFFLAAGAQVGVFVTLAAASTLGFNLQEASSIGLIGAADGPTAIYLALKLAPHLVGPIALAAYLYMALIPRIQTPIIRSMTTKEERLVPLETPPVSKTVRVLFPLAAIALGILVAPPAGPMLAMLMGGNLLRESGIAERLKTSSQTEFLRVATFILGVGAGLTMEHSKFLNWGTPTIIFIGLIGFSLSTACGLVIGKLMFRLSGGKVNPLVGTFRLYGLGDGTAEKGQAAANCLLINAMGANIAGVIGTVVSAGILLAIVGNQ